MTRGEVIRRGIVVRTGVEVGERGLPIRVVDICYTDGVDPHFPMTQTRDTTRDGLKKGDEVIMYSFEIRPPVSPPSLDEFIVLERDPDCHPPRRFDRLRCFCGT